ncbi:MAG TPA: hypothetical protein GX747_05150 [Tenericutes bacterium]|nr:hypothetical protein [Mycoplasmatota bacterium]
MQHNIINVRVVSLMRDFITIGLIMMSSLLLIFIIRATGFDIKKFNFGRDLQELEIQEEDNEEFEVNVEFNSNEINRGIRRRIRFAKYVYVENKFLINIVVLIFFIIVSFFIYIRLTTMDTIYKQKDIFSSTNFVMHVDNSYITNKNYKGDKITDNVLLIVDLKIRGKYGKALQFDTYSLYLDVNGSTYTPTIKYKEQLIDLGINYTNQNITREDFNYILVFEIPKISNTSNLILKYVDKINYSKNSLKPKYVRVKVEPFNLDSTNETKSFQIGETIEINNTGLAGGKISIINYELKDVFKVPYRFCVTNNECFTSYEYLKPNIINNYEKAILKINGEIENSRKVDSKVLIDIYSYIDSFGILKYTINGKERVQKISFKQVKPTKFKTSNTFYIEVLNEVLKADKIFLEFNIRGIGYTYNLK